MDREIKAQGHEVTRLNDHLRHITRENEDMATRLEVQQREYLKMIEETRDNADLIAMKGQGDGDEVRDMRSRIHLLTEENHALFDQVTLLRAHFDSFNKDCANQMEEASAKAQAFDLLHGQVSKLIEERDFLLA